jgi:hypothetical protein
LNEARTGEQERCPSVGLAVMIGRPLAEWANKVWKLSAGAGSEVSLKDFRKDVSIEFSFLYLAFVLPHGISRHLLRSETKLHDQMGKNILRATSCSISL